LTDICYIENAMSIDERLEYLLKVQESHEANINRLFDLHAQLADLHAQGAKRIAAIENSLKEFIQHTDQTLNSVARILASH
jgi:hypothetical protein